MNDRLRTVLVPTLAAACAVAMAASASAAEKNTHSELRVEAIGKTLEAGTNYSNASIRTRNSKACGRRNSRTDRIRGPKALNLIGHAARVNPQLRPFRTSDTDEDLGILVCQIGDFKGFGQRSWLYKVNHQFASLGGSNLNVGRRDEVLWYFANFQTGRNTGDELALRQVPVAVRPGRVFEVRVVAYDGEGTAIPEAGARVTRAPTPTGVGGTTTVVARSTPGTMHIEAEHGDDIPAAPVEVCVANDLSRCPDARGEAFVGTGDADAIRGTGGPDSIRPRGGRDAVTARGGADRVAVRGGGRDRVNCGPGRDRVTADREDRVGDNCEAVERRR